MTDDGPPAEWFGQMEAEDKAWEARLAATPRPAYLTVSVRSGTEGPRNDPYAFQEYAVTMSWGVIITYHTGLDEWMRVGDGPRVIDNLWDGRSAALLRFEALVGFDLDQLGWWGGLFGNSETAPCMACGRLGCAADCCI